MIIHPKSILDKQREKTQMDCCVFVGLNWLRNPSCSKRIGYHQLSEDDCGAECSYLDNSVTVVVGREKRVFVVDPYILEKDPFRVLLETMRRKKKKREYNSNREERVIFLNVDAILFEHMLWLMYNDWSSFLELNLTEIIEFYSQDF